MPDEKDYSDLFSLYLDDINDEESIPSEFIFSSKIIFLSNAQYVPKKVKNHTLSLVISSSLEDTEKQIEKYSSTIINDAFSKSVPDQVRNTALEDLRHLKKDKGSIEDMMKLVVIRASGIPEDKARLWILNQD